MNKFLVIYGANDCDCAIIKADSMFEAAEKYLAANDKHLIITVYALLDPVEWYYKRELTHRKSIIVTTKAP